MEFKILFFPLEMIVLYWLILIGMFLRSQQLTKNCWTCGEKTRCNHLLFVMTFGTYLVFLLPWLVHVEIHFLFFRARGAWCKTSGSQLVTSLKPWRWKLVGSPWRMKHILNGQKKKSNYNQTWHDNTGHDFKYDLIWYYHVIMLHPFFGGPKIKNTHVQKHVPFKASFERFRTADVMVGQEAEVNVEISSSAAGRSC